MSYSQLFAKTTLCSTNDAAYYLSKYGHFLKWKNYKENVIEVGCADGAITKEVLYPFLGNRAGKLEAIDKLAPMIEYANNYNHSKHIEYKTKHILDKEYIESNDGKVDHIFSFYAAHWVPETRPLLQGFHKMLTPGGQIFITTLYDSPGQQSFRKVLKEEKWLQYLPEKDCFANYGENPKKYMHGLLKDTNFEINSLTSERVFGDISNFKDFMRSAVHMYDHLDLLPENLQEQFIQELIEGACDNCFYLGEPDKYRMFYEGLIIVATKINKKN